MTSPAVDPIEFGTELLSLVQFGRRDSTYKLATMTALLQIAPVRADEDHGDGVRVSILDITDYVARLYWNQVLRSETADGLRQVKQSGSRLFRELEQLRELADRGRYRPRDDQNAGWAKAHKDLAYVVAEMPLAHLQNTHGGGRTPLLYDEPWLVKKVRRQVLDDHEWTLTLLPGVAASLARLSGMLVPLIQAMWVAEVRRINDIAPDYVESRLFSRDRAGFHGLAGRLSEIQDGRCFYCKEPVEAGRGHVDHVLPWSRTGLDDLANLVLSCRGCNLDKSDVLPHPGHVRRAVSRDLSSLVGFAGLSWEPHEVRVIGEALLRWSPLTAILWVERGSRIAVGEIGHDSDLMWPAHAEPAVVVPREQDGHIPQRASAPSTIAETRI